MIFHFVFSQAFQGMRSYSLYVLSGLVMWQYFSNAANGVIQSLVANAGIIKTINVPLLAFPWAAVLTEIINLGFVFIPFFALMLFFGLEISPETLGVLIPVMLLGGFALGMGMVLGVLNVYLRDVSILWNAVNPALFDLTPIAYTLDFVPETYHIVLKANPLFPFFQATRDALYSNAIPDMQTILMMLAWSGGSLILGFVLFRKLQAGVISNL